MSKFSSKIGFSALLIALCMVLITSCSVFSDGGSEFSISIKNESVSPVKGQQFVSVKCSDAWTLGLFDDEDNIVDWAELSAYSGAGDKGNVILSYNSNNQEVSRRLRIVLSNGSRSVECSMLQYAQGAQPEPEDPDGPDSPGTGDNLAKAGWMELPAMNNPNLGYYNHHFKMNGKSYRNYSFGWSQKDRVALWVAYPLCTLYTNGNAGRTEAWQLDPLLGENSAAPFGGYAGNYDRGHQLPSADRQCCYEANAQTYYGTNMTPQLPGLNQKIWAKLEDKVRGYANASDTTYVVTGCIVNSSSKTEKDSYGNKVTIPDAYFKAILKYSKSSTLGAWNAIAFYFQHKEYSESNVGKQHAMSIDKLEEITGLDFFVNLPAKLGEDKAAKIEAADPTASEMWW